MISTQASGDVTAIRIDRPERRNALDAGHCAALGGAVREAVRGGARALVITGSGTSFCSGADLDEVYAREFRDALYGMLHAITGAPVPVIAAVNGPAIGAGTQLAIACDLRVAADSARFAVPTARIGLAVDPWTVRRLALLAGGGPARAMLLGCESLTAAQAHERGLVDRLGGLSDALGWAQEIAALAPLTLSYSKLAANSLEVPGDEGELLAGFDACWDSEDIAEGRRARAEKRQPRFQGR